MNEMLSSFKIKTFSFSKPLNNLTVRISSPVVINVLFVVETKQFLAIFNTKKNGRQLRRQPFVNKNIGIEVLHGGHVACQKQ